MRDGAEVVGLSLNLSPWLVGAKTRVKKMAAVPTDTKRICFGKKTLQKKTKKVRPRKRVNKERRRR